MRAVQLRGEVAEELFTAEIAENAEKISCAVVAGSSVHLAMRDGKSRGLVVTGLFSVISAQAGIQ
ncbi:MAG: hypothetical protein ACLP5H_06280 [Desulfomonilaceae bacterium]